MTANGYSIQKRSGNKRDEYYTTYEEVEYIFTKVIKEDLSGKIIYCPFDRDENNFVIYLKEHKDEVKYKELWHTGDDYIISNPPFSLLLSDILPMFRKYDKKFFIFGSLSNCYNYIKTYNPSELKYMRRPRFVFITPQIMDITGEKYVNVSGTIYLTNLEASNKIDKLNKKFFTKSFNDIEHHYCKDDNILVIDKMADFPNDYDGPVRCPVSCCEWKYKKYLNCLYVPKYHNYEDRARYVRVVCQKKKHFE